MRKDRQPGFSLWQIHIPWTTALLQRFSADQLFVSSFLLLILTGTLGLKLLPGMYTGAPLSWLDALFTITSAVCVTGLVVVDTATWFTFWGQVWIMLFIQLGGLSIIAFTSLIILAFGQRLSLRQESLVSSMTDLNPQIDHRQLAKDVVRFTLVIEGIGAVLLWLCWGHRLGWGEAAWHAVFHAISAFCNAGFSTFTPNLIAYQQAPLTLLVIMLLIVSGGIGFLTLEEFADRYRRKNSTLPGRFWRMSLHSRVVLTTTAVLIFGGAVFCTFFEWNLTFDHLPWYHKLMNGLFMSVTARTAGFNTIDYGQASAAGTFFTILLMFIGGSPGSTAGGIKTTNAALIVLAAWSRLKGDTYVNVGGRSIPETTIQRAIGLTVIAFTLVTAGIFLLTMSESSGVTHAAAQTSFLETMFETVSAFATVGLSMGITASLSGIGKGTLILLMFLGRVGPLVFAAALARRQAGASMFRFAYEEVAIG